MANDYKSFYLSDLEARISKVALDAMMSPQKTLLGDQAQKVESLSVLNDRIAQYNEGVRGMALMLQANLRKDEEDE